MKWSLVLGILGVLVLVILGSGWLLWTNAEQESEQLQDAVAQLETEVAELREAQPDSSVTSTPEPLSETESETSSDSTINNDTSSTANTIRDTQNISPLDRSYVVALPRDWLLEESEGPKGVQISYVQLVSPTFSTHTDPDFEGPFEPIYYDEGAIITIHVTQGEEGSIPAGEILERREFEIGGQPATWMRFREPSTLAGEIISVNTNYGGNNYLLRMAFNPKTFPEGVQILEAALDTWRFDPE